MLHALLLLLPLTATATNIPPNDPVLSFRDLFAANVKRRDPARTNNDVRGMMLLPTPELLHASRSFHSLRHVDAEFAKVRPSDLEAQGISVPIKNVDPTAGFAARAAKGQRPVTIFVICGMFGEFAPQVPFQSALDPSSSFARTYAAALTARPTTDTVWDLQSLEDIEVPLDSLVSAGSVDATNGTAQYQIVWLLQPEGSLESLVRPEIVVPRLVSRMKKFLSLVGSSVDDFVILGYSRGVIDALEIMSKRDILGWRHRLRGIISLNGVSFGAANADCYAGDVQSDPPEMCEQLSKAASVLNRLRDDLVPEMESFDENTKTLKECLGEVIEAFVKLPITPELLGVKVVAPDPQQTWDEIIKQIVFGIFDIWHPVRGYEDNIRRVKVLCASVTESIELLTTNNRLKWYRSHTLPTDGLYMAMTSTMKNKDINEPVMHPDVFFMRKSYYEAAAAGAGEVCDGQLSAGRELIMPQVHRELNPRQGSYTSHWLGVGLVDHLGVAMDHFIPCADEWENPFSRLSLIDSFAAWVAIHTA